MIRLVGSKEACEPLSLLLQARTRKLEAESKLAGLQKDLAELGSVSGDQAGQEEAQTSLLHQVCCLFSTAVLISQDCNTHCGCFAAAQHIITQHSTAFALAVGCN